jgi:Fic family protein
MDAARFVAPDWGRAVNTGGQFGYVAFRPQPLPRELALAGRTVLALSDADAALGRLVGAGRLLPAPHLLVTPYLAREAVASSRIEGTQASLSDVFEANATDAVPNADLQEVRNYIAAVEHGINRLPDLPLSMRLMRECHGVLMSGVRGAEKTPGELRQSQNWIGAASATVADAAFVPPPPEDLGPTLQAWETYIHDPQPRLPLLIRSALLHYQFETIHPFLDGNGRLGRVFVVLHLLQEQRITAPLLYLSAHLEQNRTTYYERLQAVRERGEVQEWLQFFLQAISTQAADAVTRAEALVDLREEFRSRLRGKRSRATEVVDLLFGNPVMTVRIVVNRLGVTPQGAALLLRQLVEAKILDEPRTGPGRRTRYTCQALMTVLAS